MPATLRSAHAARGWLPRRPRWSAPALRRRQSGDISGSEFASEESGAEFSSDGEDDLDLNGIAPNHNGNNIAAVGPALQPQQQQQQQQQAQVAGIDVNIQQVNVPVDNPAPVLNNSVEDDEESDDADDEDDEDDDDDIIVQETPVVVVDTPTIVQETPTLETPVAAEPAVVETVAAGLQTPPAQQTGPATTPVLEESPATSVAEVPEQTGEPAVENGLPDTASVAEMSPELENGGGNQMLAQGKPSTNQNLAQSIGIVIGTLALLAFLMIVGIIVYRRVRAKRSGLPSPPLLPRFSNPFARNSSQGDSLFGWHGGWSKETPPTPDVLVGPVPRKTNSEMINTLARAAFRAEDGQNGGGGGGAVDAGYLREFGEGGTGTVPPGAGGDRATNYFGAMEGYWDDKDNASAAAAAKNDYHRVLREPASAVVPGGPMMSPISPKTTYERRPSQGAMRVSFDILPHPDGRASVGGRTASNGSIYYR